MNLDTNSMPEVTKPDVTPDMQMEVPDYVVDLSAPFPRSKYIIRVVEESYKPSSKGKDMLKLEWEAIYPDAIRIGRPYSSVPKMFQVKGLLQGTCYCMLDPKSLSNDKLTGRKFFQKLGVFIPDDTSNPLASGNIFKGKCFEVVGQSKLREQFGQEYDENGDLKNVVLKGPDGNPLMVNQFSFFFNDDSVIRQVSPSELPESNIAF